MSSCHVSKEKDYDIYLKVLLKLYGVGPRQDDIHKKFLRNKKRIGEKHAHS
jgi:hypothetical protein